MAETGLSIKLKEADIGDGSWWNISQNLEKFS